MILYIVPLLYVLLNIKRKSISFYLFTLYTITIFVGLLIGKTVVINDIKDLFNVIYLLLVFFIIYHSFSRFKNVKYIEDIPHNKQVDFFLKTILYIGMFCFVMNLYTGISAFSNVFSNDIQINDYKNGSDENGEYVNSLMNRSLLSIVRTLSPLSYLAMGLHFYYLNKGDIKKAILYFFPATNILLVSMWSLSRSSFVEFGFVYLFYLLLLSPSFSKELKRSMKKYIIVVGGGIFVLFVVMTTNRFGDMVFYDSESKIKDPIVYSLIIYASQSHWNSVKLLHSYNGFNGIELKPSLALYNNIVDRLTGSHQLLRALEEKDMKFGSLFASFTSGPSNLVYEFGYFGSFLFWILIFYIVRRLSPRDGKISFVSLLLYCPLIDLISTSYMGNRLYLPLFHIGCVYVIIFSLIISFTKNKSEKAQLLN